MTTANTILLKGPAIHEEYPASAALKPGHLLELLSTGKVQKHSTSGGTAEKMFAKEDALQGNTITTAYAADDVVSCVIASPGTTVQGRLAANATAVVKGDMLVSAGDGTLKKPASLGTHTLNASVAASTGVSNGVTTEQDFDVTYTLPAATLAAGDILHIRGFAVVSAAAGTDTLTFKLYLGATVLVASAAVNATTGDIVEFDMTVVCRTAGASGTFVAFGYVANGVPGTATAMPAFLGSTSIDTTTSKVIKGSATWSATTSTCTVALQSLTVTIERVAPSALLAVAQESIDNSSGSIEAFIRARVL